MSSSRHRQPLADGFHSEEPARVVEWTVPHAPDDRGYLTLIYQEHACLARQEEYLRTAWSAALLVLCTVLVLAAQDPMRQWACGLLLSGTGALGALALSKHYVRYKLHHRMMRAFRKELAQTVRSDISRLTTVTRIQHDRDHRMLGWFSLHAVFLLFALAMIGAGVEMAWRSVEASSTIAALGSTPARLAEPP